MALPMPDLPMPPDLAADEPPIPDGELNSLLDDAVVMADDSAISPGEAVAVLAVSDGAPAWRITDLGGAEWAMRHVATADRTLAELTAQREAWAARIDDWFRRAASREQARRWFFAGHLQQWALAQREASGGRTKSVALPSGRVATVEHKPKIVVADEAAVIEWADAVLDDGDASTVAPVTRKVYLNPLREFTTMVEVIDHAKLLLANTGEIVEWVRYGFAPPIEDCPPDGWISGGERERCPQPGDGWPTPAEANDLVARVEVLESHDEVHGPNGLPVPGTAIAPGYVSATVTAEAP